MASNPCLTFLLVYSGIVTVSLIITSALLGTNHGRTMVCSGGEVEEEIVNTHYSVFDNSEDDIGEKDLEKICQCHCNCAKEEIITGIEVFVVTSLGILILALMVYCCSGIKSIILERKKINEEQDRLEAERKESEEKELRRKMFQELLPEAIELGAIQKKPKPIDLE